MQNISTIETKTGALKKYCSNKCLPTKSNIFIRIKCIIVLRYVIKAQYEHTMSTNT